MVADFLIDQFTCAIDRTRRLYVDSVIECYLADPKRVGIDHDDFFADLQHRYACLVIKAFVETAESDLVWTQGEAALAKTLVEHLLQQRVRRSKLKETFAQLSEIAKGNLWAHVTEPMTWFTETNEHFEEFKSGILQIANIAAKVDGHVSSETINQLKLIRWQLDQHLGSLTGESSDEADTHSETHEAEADAGELGEDRLSDVLIQLIDQDSEPKPESAQSGQASPAAPTCDLTPEQRQAELEKGLEELDRLIGIVEVQHEVRTLINVCKLQQYRAEHEMPVSAVSLHMVFAGNPGTGKTTVARIVGKLFGAMGMLQRGHLVETDRGGLVAEYLGQTAQKTNAKIEHFGNGRLVRNLFEHAIRELANRVVLATDLTPDLLSTFQPEDLPESCAAP
jgi:hypothetical protein